VLGSGREEHRAWTEPLGRWLALPGGAGTVSEAVLAVRYHTPLILFGPHEAFSAFPSGWERTDSLTRVCAFLQSVVSAPSGDTPSP